MKGGVGAVTMGMGQCMLSSCALKSVSLLVASVQSFYLFSTTTAII